MSTLHDPVDLGSALTLSGAVTYTKVYYVNSVYLPNTTPGAPGSLVVAAGDELAGPGSAPWTSTDSVDYRFPAARTRPAAACRRHFQKSRRGDVYLDAS